MTAVVPSGPVSPLEDLRRAVRSDQFDENAQLTSAPFSSENLSVDVASLAPLIESRRRFPDKWLAIFPCRAAVEVGAPPMHDPLPENDSHAIIPGRLSRGQSRKLKAAVTSMIGPFGPSS